MYGFNDRFSEARFVGTELITVSHVVNTIWLDFGTWSVSVSGSVGLRDESGDSWETPPVSESRIVGLLGDAVVSCEVEPKAFELQLASGRTVLFRDDSERYECYLFQFGDREVAV